MPLTVNRVLPATGPAEGEVWWGERLTNSVQKLKGINFRRKKSINFTHFSYIDSPTLLEYRGLDDTAPTGQAVQYAVGSAVATSVVST